MSKDKRGIGEGVGYYGLLEGLKWGRETSVTSILDHRRKQAFFTLKTECTDQPASRDITNR